MAYRDDLTALSARHDALAAEVAQKTRELKESRQLLEQARARAKLPMLDQIRVASPCTADWNQMTGDDRTRHCGECQKNVYNLSGMTREEAEALIVERNGDLCVRYYQRQDGTILLADCSVGAQRLRRRNKTAARAAALVAGGLVAAGAMAPHMMVMGKMAPRDELRIQPEVTMGLLAAPDPPPADQAVPSQNQPDVEEVFPPPSMQLPADRPPAPNPPQPRLDAQPMMGAVRALTWDDPTPSQPAAHPTRHRPAAASKRAR